MAGQCFRVLRQVYQVDNFNRFSSLLSAAESDAGLFVEVEAGVSESPSCFTTFEAAALFCTELASSSAF